jgi:hypothetical protein
MCPRVWNPPDEAALTRLLGWDETVEWQRTYDANRGGDALSSDHAQR